MHHGRDGSGGKVCVIQVQETRKHTSCNTGVAAWDTVPYSDLVIDLHHQKHNLRVTQQYPEHQYQHIFRLSLNKHAVNWKVVYKGSIPLSEMIVGEFQISISISYIYIYTFVCKYISSPYLFCCGWVEKKLNVFWPIHVSLNKSHCYPCSCLHPWCYNTFILTLLTYYTETLNCSVCQPFYLQILIYIIIFLNSSICKGFISQPKQSRQQIFSATAGAKVKPVTPTEA